MPRTTIEQATSKDTVSPQGADRHQVFLAQDQATFQRLCDVIAGICPAWLGEQREDLAQKAMLRILEWVKRSKTHQELTQVFLYRVAQSVVVDEVRAARREKNKHREHTQRTVVSQSGAVEAPIDTPERATEKGIQIDHIRTCMRSLSNDKRMALTLMLQGYSQKEAAQMLNWKPKKVENHSLRGKAELRACLRARGVRA